MGLPAAGGHSSPREQDFSASGGTSQAVADHCNLEEQGYMVGLLRNCASPKHYGSLRSGAWTFYVYAKGTNGEKSNTASHQFVIP